MSKIYIYIYIFAAKNLFHNEVELYNFPSRRERDSIGVHIWGTEKGFSKKPEKLVPSPNS